MWNRTTVCRLAPGANRNSSKIRICEFTGWHLDSIMVRECHFQAEVALSSIADTSFAQVNKLLKA